jgi:hypothetical protein
LVAVLIESIIKTLISVPAGTAVLTGAAGVAGAEVAAAGEGLAGRGSAAAGVGEAGWLASVGARGWSGAAAEVSGAGSLEQAVMANIKQTIRVANFKLMNRSPSGVYLDLRLRLFL